MVLEKQLIRSIWNKMHKNLQLHTYGGRMDLIYLKDFPDKVTRAIMTDDGRYLSYPVSNGNTISKVDVELKHYYSITGAHMNQLKYISNVRDHLESTIYLASNTEIINSMKTLTANTMPTFFLKDLDMNAINNLSKEHLMEYGDGDAVGIHIELSTSQKFFVICFPDDFKFHYSQVRDANRDHVHFRGALINYKPRKFIMGRYENLEYLKELSAMRMYQP